MWEPCRHDHDAYNSSPAWVHDTEAQEPTQTSVDRLQQIHRWLDESTWEEIQEILHLQQWAGSTLLRTLNTNKLQRRQQWFLDRHYLHAGRK
jgi:hypothetical protein